MTRIGRYEVEAEIGRGAMGVVYLARDPRLHRRVALKTYSVPEGLPADRRREAQARFLREARAAAVLTHPAIVTVYDVEQDAQRAVPFIAMEYVPGKTLRELIDDPAGLEPARAVEIVSAAAEALHAAHTTGIVHRDVKPANILIREPDGAVKITDFGIARLPSSELTQTGIALGSPAYMSPEQVGGGRLDGRSDLFSLAVILYEALCSERPFPQEDTPALLYSIVHETPLPIRRRVPDLPEAMDGFFDRALAKQPERRFADGCAFREALLQAWSAASGGGTASATVVDQPTAIPVSIGSGGGPSFPIGEAELATAEEGNAGLAPRRLVIAALFAVLLAVGTWSVLGGRSHAYLRLDAKSTIEEGQLVLLVDGKKVFERALSAPAQKRGIIRKVLDKKPETFETWLEIPPGKHEVAAHVTSATEGAEYRDSIVVDLEARESRRLRLVAGRVFGRDLSLKLD